jgi:hypothetical protein
MSTIKKFDLKPLISFLETAKRAIDRNVEDLNKGKPKLLPFESFKCFFRKIAALFFHYMSCENLLKDQVIVEQILSDAKTIMLSFEKKERTNNELLLAAVNGLISSLELHTSQLEYYNPEYTQDFRKNILDIIDNIRLHLTQ